MSIITKSNYDRIVNLAKDTTKSTTHMSFADQAVYHFGSSRKDEIAATIGDNGQPYEKLLNEYLDTL